MTRQEYEVCRDIGFRTAVDGWNFCKRAQAIKYFFGDDGVYAFKYGYDIGVYTSNPYKPYLAWRTIKSNIQRDLRNKFFKLFKEREMMRKLSKALQEKKEEEE